MAGIRYIIYVLYNGLLIVNRKVRRDVAASNSRIGADFLEMMTAMFNPLPAIALQTLALIWFGLGSGSLVFVLIHSVLWAVALNTNSGFLSVSQRGT